MRNPWPERPGPEGGKSGDNEKNEHLVARALRHIMQKLFGKFCPAMFADSPYAGSGLAKPFHQILPTDLRALSAHFRPLGCDEQRRRMARSHTAQGKR